ncbi:MGMT family protein [Bacillus sp. B-jedd]|uniref:MGMT family protein n=1 Tax=Bacillus sp. B-jedd TaxID=1476857 RepID=UPI00051558BD|nr:MGMT family protein [Bacillus sp. B-jedd]CEG29306.1 DNA methyltransferase, DNA binding domain-containing protein [Bacillus sp. B-jedd]
MSPFTKRVIDIISKIPPGKVMTYGQVAKVAGSPRAARQVVRILHSMSGKYNLPWHRVINAQGEIPIKDEEAKSYQRDMLLEEGVPFIARKVDLPSCLYEPGAYEEEED